MPLIVTKFGGTSVSSRETWQNIAIITKAHIARGDQPLIVCSALTQISNKLEKAITLALTNEHETLLKDIVQSHHHLACALDVPEELVNHELEALEKLLTGIALLKEAPPKTRARVLSLGELMLTRLGHAFLEREGITCQWKDARDLLESTPMPGNDPLNWLAARCDSTPDPKLAESLHQLAPAAIITQGFFARDPGGDTVLLGRGGSDTSAALLAAILGAKACEIWTDVPGIYTANPHLLPHARLLRHLHYDEAQEIATMGARVLHPNCLPPVRRANIPMTVKFTRRPEHPGTLISEKRDASLPAVKSIQVRNNVILISIDTLHMWQQVGFLAEVFAVFRTHGFSVDLLSSSEFNVTVSLDSNAQLRDSKALDALVQELATHGRVKRIDGCSAVSLVGHPMQTVLPQLGPALEALAEEHVYLMSMASNGLNLSFVVNTAGADNLCRKLHALLIENNHAAVYCSKSWHEEFGNVTEPPLSWWQQSREKLLNLAKSSAPCFVYHLPTVREQARKLARLDAVNKRFYAIKANPHPAILSALRAEGVAFECVSLPELKHVFAAFPDISPEDVLFTPNFAPREEYREAMKYGCHVTVDNLSIFQEWGEDFRGKKVILRIDPGLGAGHHRHVCTGGSASKFGIGQESLAEVRALSDQYGFTVKGLHIHAGSGVHTPQLWQQNLLLLTQLANDFPDVRILNVGGGLGVAERAHQNALCLEALNAGLLAARAEAADVAVWLEPGRFYVAESGVLLAHVTQCKQKSGTRFVGIETGMNSLIRPALYGAWHEMVNLTRLDTPCTELVHVVGPICETGDTFGQNRPFPPSKEGDVVLIANAGAYGHCMGSHYNLRPPAQECILD